jgi:hypothetical protein
LVCTLLDMRWWGDGRINNPDFKLVEFDQFKNQAGSNSLVLSLQFYVLCNPTLVKREYCYTNNNKLLFALFEEPKVQPRSYTSCGRRVSRFEGENGSVYSSIRNAVRSNLEKLCRPLACAGDCALQQNTHSNLYYNIIYCIIF